MLRFTKAHAYGNDFLYVRQSSVEGAPLDAVARELCDRHTGIGADGLVVFEPTPDGASMRLFNADGSRAEVSGNGVRALGAILMRPGEAPGPDVDGVTIHTEAGPKRLTRMGGSALNGVRQTFRAAMGLPRDLRQIQITSGGEALRITVMDFGNPQAVRADPRVAVAQFAREHD